LAFAGLFGRVFCASVCPLGAVQDVVLIRGVRVPSWLGQSLRLMAYAYLGIAILYVVVGQQFMICRYDPFVSFFRLSGPSGLLKWGFFVLALSTVIGRPYCRFLCPYSVLLSLFSRWSYRHASITPDQCINCGLCESACPFGAIRRPLSGSVKPFKGIPIILLLALPLALAGLGYGAGPFLSRPDKTVKLARLLAAEEGTGQAKASLETQVFLEQKGDAVSLVAQARDTERRFSIGTCLFGMFMGTVIAWRLWRLSRRPPGQTYEMDRSDCISCGRCFELCPRDRASRMGPHLSLTLASPGKRGDTLTTGCP
jgi:ferredoxin